MLCNVHFGMFWYYFSSKTVPRHSLYTKPVWQVQPRRRDVNIYIYIYTYICTYIYTHIYIYQLWCDRASMRLLKDLLRNKLVSTYIVILCIHTFEILEEIDQATRHWCYNDVVSIYAMLYELTWFYIERYWTSIVISL